MSRLARSSWLLAVALAAAIPGPLAEETSAPAPAPVKQIKMLARNWEFIPARIEVVQGTRLEITIESKHAPHSFLLKDFGLDVKLPQDKVTVVEFVADKAGEFKWRCGRPCGDGCPKMQGILVVKPVERQP